MMKVYVFCIITCLGPFGLPKAYSLLKSRITVKALQDDIRDNVLFLMKTFSQTESVLKIWILNLL